KSKEIIDFSLNTENQDNIVRWVWYDRNCVDIYGFCCLDQPLIVPKDFLDILVDQTVTTNVAIIIDTPKNLIYQHLAARICGQQSTNRMRFVTKLLILIPYMVETTLQTLDFIGQWYNAFNIPVIKISQIYPKLDKDEETQEILWTKHSIDILLNTIEDKIKNKQPTTDQQLILQEQLKKPWLTRIRQDSCVY
ncbi:unnamed protein product, partial [Rotaria sp. Silwood1]